MFIVISVKPDGTLSAVGFNEDFPQADAKFTAEVENGAACLLVSGKVLSVSASLPVCICNI
jgi:hypothetical protein